MIYVDRHGTTWHVAGLLQRTVVLPIGAPRVQQRDARIVFASRGEAWSVVVRPEVLLALAVLPPRELAALCARLLRRARAGKRR